MIAIVTGGSSGIGQALCRLLLQKGATVYCLSRREGPAGCRSIPTDLTSDESVAHAFQIISAECPHVDLLVNNAGMGISGATELTDLSAAHRLFEVNFFSVLRTLRPAVPLLSGGGCLIQISSAAALFAIPYQSLYSASKSALLSLSLALRAELEPFGIRVAALLPGDVRTGFTAAREKSTAGEERYRGIEKSVARMERDEQNGLSPETVAHAVWRTFRRKSPKPYAAVGFSYRLLCTLSKFLPARLVSFALSRLYCRHI